MHKKSIKSDIIRSMIMLLIISGGITIAVMTFLVYRQMDNQKIHDIQALSTEKSNTIKIFLDRSSDIVEHLNNNPLITDWALNPNQQNTESALSLFNTINIKNRYSAIYILDKTGQAIISTDPTFLNNNYSFRPYFKNAIAGQSNMDIAVGVTSLEQGYYFASPINYGQDTVGVLVVKLSPGTLYKMLSDAVQDTNSHVMLTDQYGVILYSDLKEREFSSLGQLGQDTLLKIQAEKKYLNFDIKSLQYDKAQRLLTNQAKLEPMVYRFFDFDDQENEIISVSPIQNYPLFLVNEDSAWELSAGAINLALITSLLIILSTLSLLLFISIIITKRLKPMELLTKMVKKIGQGNLSVRNEVKSGDELEHLGDFIEETAHRLKSSYSNLEHQVEERTVEISKKNEYLDKTKTAIINILEDVEIEKNKTAESADNLRKFKLALDSSSDHILITDPEGIVIYGNKMVEVLTGYSLAETVGKKAGTLWSYPMSQDYYAKLWNTIKTEKKPLLSTLKNRRKDGQEYEASVSIAPVLDDKNEIKYFIGIERDITHEKMVDRAKTEFVSLASHQLRTPLSSVNWYAEMLLAGDGGKLNKEQAGFVQEIYAGNQRMVELVNSLLNVSRLELGTFAVEPEPTNIVEIAQSVIKELQPSIIAKSLKLTFNYDKNTPIIQADPKLIRIIFQNLLSNSVKYTSEKGLVSLTINNDKKNLLIEVTDNGYGIPKKEQYRIFEKLFRAENVRAMDTEGTGLGLYIVKSIIKHAGGQISFKSAENKGTSFKLSIPLSGMKKKEGDKKIE